MKRLLALMIVFISIALVCPALAQPGQSRRSQRGAASAIMTLIRLYNPETVTTVKGQVASLGTLPPHTQVVGALRTAILKTEQGDITAFLAPDGYLEEHKGVLKAGDEVEVTGSKVTVGKQGPAIIVKDLKVGGKSIALRDAEGLPIWMGPPASGSPAK